jgi:tetratricopeptide (TPR) repeat protein
LKTDDLLLLINSLSKAEKRHFRLFVGRHSESEDVLFVNLFDLLDKKGTYDEAVILKKIPAVKKNQLPNLKAHLYKQILISLRLLAKNQNEDIQIREQIDYAKVLYNRGFYIQCLECLDKAKEKAMNLQYSSLALEIVEFEKFIESQYITHSFEGRAEELVGQSQSLTQKVQGTQEMSSLSLQMYGLFLKTGFARNEKEYFFVREFFKSRLPETEFETLDFWGKVYYCQAHVWMFNICQEFPLCYKYAQRWVDLFESESAMKRINAPLYLKGLHNLLMTLFHSLQYERFKITLNVLRQFSNAVEIRNDRNIDSLYHLYYFLHTINLHYLEGSFSEGLEFVPKLVEGLENESFAWDEHRIMLFYYRISCLYFGAGDLDKTILYLNKITQKKNPDYREDIQCFARILSLIAHYELGNLQLLEYQIKSVYRFLLQMQDMHEVQKEVFKFLRRTPTMQSKVLFSEFRSLHKKLVALQSDPFERRPFMYLDIISWLESKMQNVPIQQVIRAKFLEKKIN